MNKVNLLKLFTILTAVIVTACNEKDKDVNQTWNDYSNLVLSEKLNEILVEHQKSDGGKSPGFTWEFTNEHQQIVNANLQYFPGNRGRATFETENKAVDIVQGNWELSYSPTVVGYNNYIIFYPEKKSYVRKIPRDYRIAKLEDMLTESGISESLLNEYTLYADSVRFAFMLRYSLTRNPDGSFARAKNSVKEGLMTGEWRFYYPNQKLKAVGYYNGGDASVISKRWRIPLNGREGSWTFYYPDGQVCYQTSYYDNMLNGAYTEWYESEQLKRKGRYNLNQPEGLWTWWYPNGSKSREGKWRRGRQVGEWTYYNEDGTERGTVYF